MLMSSEVAAVEGLFLPLELVLRPLKALLELRLLLTLEASEVKAMGGGDIEWVRCGRAGGFGGSDETTAGITSQ